MAYLPKSLGCANHRPLPPTLHSDVTSEESTVQFNIYDRADEEHGFMGSVQVRPTLVHDHTVDQWYKYVLHILPPQLSDASQDSALTKMNLILLEKFVFRPRLSSTRCVLRPPLEVVSLSMLVTVEAFAGPTGL